MPKSAGGRIKENNGEHLKDRKRCSVGIQLATLFDQVLDGRERGQDDDYLAKSFKAHDIA